MKRIAQIVLSLVVVIAVSGCGSISARWEDAKPPYDTGVYRGVRMYVHEITADFTGQQPAAPEPAGVASVESKKVDYRACPGDLVLFVVFPFVVADMLVLTPVCDTVLLPYDLLTLMTDRRDNRRQSPARYK
jgi:uncharacterized protein YceK